MSHRIYEKMADSLKDGCRVSEPDSSGGTFALVPQRSYQYCRITRTSPNGYSYALPSPEAFPIGARFAVFISAMTGTDMNITGARSTITFATTGDSAVFWVTKSGTSKQWSLLYNDGGA